MAGEGLRSHLSGSVPVSIVVHLVLLLVLVVIPLAGDIVAPIPALMLPSYVLAEPLPAPPPAAPRPAPPRAPSPVTSAVPTTAPDRLVPEPPMPPPLAPIDAVPGGLPSGVGADVNPLSIDAPPTSTAPASLQAPVREAQLPEPPHKLVDVRPAYPDLARSARIEGTVILEAVLDTSGHVTQVRVLKSVPMLDQAALDAVRQWRYSPTIYYGRAVSVLMTITVRFTLQP